MLLHILTVSSVIHVPVCVFVGGMIGAVTVFSASRNAPAAAYYQKVACLQSFFQYRKVTQTLRAKILKYQEQVFLEPECTRATHTQRCVHGRPGFLN